MGNELSLDAVKRFLKPERIFKTLFITAFFAVTAGTLMVSGLFWYFSKTLPNIITVGDYRPFVVTQVFIKEGDESILLAEYFKERRYVVPVEKIPKKLIEAFISAEDDQFFNHQGINIASIIRAAIVNFKAGQVVQGGSTITQQVAKSLLLTPERSFVRKAKELLLSAQIEKNLSKNEILYLYLNQIYLGHGAHGVQAASRVFFNKDLGELTIAEMALIAGMPQAPGKFSPHLNPKKAKDRQSYVLRRMVENGFITKSEQEAALAERLKIFDNQDPTLPYGKYLAEYIRVYLQQKYTDKALYEDGLVILLKQKSSLLKSSQDAVREGLRKLDRRIGYRNVVRRLKKDAERVAFLEQSERSFLKTTLRFEVFTPSGELSVNEALSLGGIKQREELVPLKEPFEALVTDTVKQGTSIRARIGPMDVVIEPKNYEWVMQSSGRPIQKVIQEGDVILVRAIQKEGTKLVWELDQIPEIQGALFSMDLKTGTVLAMEGGFDFKQSEFNRATQASRQIGSAFKPFIFSAALEKGFTPASIIVDAPIVYQDEEFGKWKPTNYEEKFYGDTTFRQALIKSRNIPTIKIVQNVGVGDLIHFTERIGFKANFNRDLSIALGSGTSSLASITAAYSIFPRLGRTLTPIFFESIQNRDGAILEESTSQPEVKVETVWGKILALQNAEKTSKDVPPGEAAQDPAKEETGKPRVPLLTQALEGDPYQVLDPRVAYVSTHLMKEVVNFGTGIEARQLGKPAAGKTGTTNDYLDGWFLGFTPSVVTGVWVGYDGQKPIGSGETGAKVALPIWLEFMKEATASHPNVDFPVPPGISFVPINPQNGKRMAKSAAGAIQEAFVTGTEPLESEGEEGRHSNPSTGDFLKEDIE